MPLVEDDRLQRREAILTAIFPDHANFLCGWDDTQQFPFKRSGDKDEKNRIGNFPPRYLWPSAPRGLLLNMLLRHPSLKSVAGPPPCKDVAVGAVSPELFDDIREWLQRALATATPIRGGDKVSCVDPCLECDIPSRNSSIPSNQGCLSSARSSELTGTTESGARTKACSVTSYPDKAMTLRRILTPITNHLLKWICRQDWGTSNPTATSRPIRLKEMDMSLLLVKLANATDFVETSDGLVEKPSYLVDTDAMQPFDVRHTLPRQYAEIETWLKKLVDVVLKAEQVKQVRRNYRVVSDSSGKLSGKGWTGSEWLSQISLIAKSWTRGDSTWAPSIALEDVHSKESGESDN